MANMKFAKRVFLAAGICGVLVLLPQYFFGAENQGGDYPPPITHPPQSFITGSRVLASLGRCGS
jgi:hypothetical protein